MVPTPILTVDKPIRSSDNLATNSGINSVLWFAPRLTKLLPDASKLALTRLVAIPMGLPPFLWYVTWSPVLNLWFGKNIDLVGMNTEFLPPPGLLIVAVVPIPGPAVVPTPTDSTGLK